MPHRIVGLCSGNTGSDTDDTGEAHRRTGRGHGGPSLEFCHALPSIGLGPARPRAPKPPLQSVATVPQRQLEVQVFLPSRKGAHMSASSRLSRLFPAESCSTRGGLGCHIGRSRAGHDGGRAPTPLVARAGMPGRRDAKRPGTNPSRGVSVFSGAPSCAGFTDAGGPRCWCTAQLVVKVPLDP